jgi:hypothetical protein
LNDQVVGAHGDQVDADAAVLSGFDRKLELRPDAIVRGDKDRIAVSGRLQIEEAAKSAQLGVSTRPRGRTGQRPDCLDERISGVDRYSRVGISEGLLAHRERALETSRLDFHAVVAKRHGACSVAAS